MTAVAEPIAGTRVTVKRDDLLDALSWVGPTIPSRPPMQALLGIKIEVLADAVRLTTDNYEEQAVADVGAPGAIPAPPVLVSGALLWKQVRTLPKGGDVVLDLSASKHLRVVCGDVVFLLPLMRVDDYPVRDQPHDRWFAGTGEMLARLCAPTIAAGLDDTLPVLTGVHWEATGAVVSAAATDRYRLCFDEVTPADGVAVEAQALVPARLLKRVGKAWAREPYVEVSIVDQRATLDGHGRSLGIPTVRLSCGSRSITTATLDGHFPKWRTLIPADPRAYIDVDRKALVEGVQQAATAVDRLMPVMLDVTEDRIVVSGGRPGEDGSAAAYVSIPATHGGLLDVLAFAPSGPAPEVLTGARLGMALNPAFLLDACKALQSVPLLRASFTASNRPVVWSAEGTSLRYLLMPVRMSA